VFVWAQIPDSADRALLASMPCFRPTPAVVAGGPGWFGEAPPGVTGSEDLSDTVAKIARAAGE
jgi:hypothetical protein